MTKKPLIIKDYSKIVAKSEYLLLFKNKNKFVISYKYISAIFINSHIKVSLVSLVKLSNNFPIFLIDNSGFIKSKILKVKEDENI